MTVYNVLAPPLRDGETAPDPLGYVLVKEGFCWPALFVPGLWLLFRRMWLIFLLYLAFVVASMVADDMIANVIGVLTLLVHLLLGLEGNNLRRWTLERRGYALAGIAEGRNRDEADIRFFADWPDVVATGPSAGTAVETAKPAPEPASPEQGGVVGLFPAPGGRP
jgi:hypothetical protein